jgi:hypothetical protein
MAVSTSNVIGVALGYADGTSANLQARHDRKLG